jgi:hypothetical protein
MHPLMASLAGFLLLLGGLQVWTQWLAWQYRYHALLGASWGQVHAFYHWHKLYAPWKAVVWTWQWGSGAWRDGIVFGGLLLVGSILIGLWLKRRRRRLQPPAMEGHGHTVWATKRDLRKAGLL